MRQVSRHILDRVTEGWHVVLVMGVVSLLAWPVGAEEASDGASESGDSARAALEIEHPEMKVVAETVPVREEPKGFEWPDESFIYSGRINGAEAMRAALRTGELRYNGETPYVPVGLTARSVGFFDDLYPVDDRANTFMDPTTLFPHRSEKFFHENGKRRTYDVRYLREKYRAKVDRQKPGQRAELNTPIPAGTHDMLSWLYDLRRQSIQKGATFDYYVYDGWKITHLELRVVGEEALYTPAGWFQSWKLAYDRHIVKTSLRTKSDADSTGNPVTVSRKTTAEHSGHLWLSRDENHLPLRLTIGTSYGLGEVILLKYDRHAASDE